MRHGFLLINKPAGPTSHDIVGKVRRVLSERGVGHLGTLDPAAEGLMVLAVGAKALKVVELFAGLSKEYEADITFGATSTTYDREGMITKVEERAGWKPPSQSELSLLLTQRFLGKVSQIPPIFSAVRVSGERAYRKARQGKNVAMPAREVEIFACEVLSYKYPKARLRIECSAGTYIRTIAHDIGEVLRCGAYLSGLTRTMVGTWSLDDAHDAERSAWAHVLPLKDVLRDLESVELSDEEWNALKHGKEIKGSCPKNTIGWHGGLPCVLLEEGKAAGSIKPRKVL